MSIFIEEEGAVTLPFNAEEIAGKVIEAALEYENCPYEAEVSLLLTTDEEVRKLNCSARGAGPSYRRSFFSHAGIQPARGFFVAGKGAGGCVQSGDG